MDKLDQKLLALLRADSRRSVTEMARRLGVTRVTVQEHMRRLEQRKVIQAYTVKLHPDYERHLVEALVLIAADQKQLDPLSRQLEKIITVQSLLSISGQYDLAALVQEESTAALDNEIDRICALDGVQRTMTSVVLSTKFER